MKKLILSALAAFFTVTICFAQDAITKKTGEDIQTKILEVNQNDVKYKKADNLDGPTFTMPKSDILIIRYGNGTKDIFSEEKKTEAITSSDDLFQNGQSDAEIHYNGYKGAGTGTLVTGILVGPVLGLIPAIACSSSSPSRENLNFPSADKMKKADYSSGYNQSAYKIKRKKVWKNYWIGLAIDVVAVAILSSQGN